MWSSVGLALGESRICRAAARRLFPHTEQQQRFATVFTAGMLCWFASAGAAIAAPRLTIENSMPIQVLDTVEVVVSGMSDAGSSGLRFWITLVRADDAVGYWREWYWVEAGSPTRYQFRSLQPGRYEIRLHDHWSNRSNDYRKVYARTAFEVRPRMPAEISIEVDFEEPLQAQNPIFATVSGQDPVIRYWVTLVPGEAPIGSYRQWMYLDGAGPKEITFDGVDSGDYEIRVHDNRAGYELLATRAIKVEPESNPIPESNTVSIEIESDLLIQAGHAIRATVSGMRPGIRYWATLVLSGMPVGSYSQWMYLDGPGPEEISFNGVGSGDYEIRVHDNRAGYELAATKALHVAEQSEPDPDEGFVFSPPDLGSSAYRAPLNSFAANSGNQCTWYVFGRVMEVNKIELRFTRWPRDALDWNEILDKNYERGNEPRSGAVAVWRHVNGQIGHVAYVEHVIGDEVFYTEANFSTYSEEGGYDGGLKSAKTSSFEGDKGGKGKWLFVGYVYPAGK